MGERITMRVIARLVGLLLLLQGLFYCQASPLPDDKIDSNIDKRQLEDASNVVGGGFSTYLSPYGYYPGLSGIGIKPLRPIVPPIFPPGFFLNRFATTPPPIDPMASFFKARKDEFLNKLFSDLTLAPDPPEIEVRSVAEPTEDVDATDSSTATEIPTTTAKPKIDPSVFINKKFDFLAQLFKVINSTTVAPPLDPTADPTATTVKPTIVPPGFWIPLPLPPKPPKAPKAPKPPKLPKAPKTTKTPATTKATEATEEGVLLSEPEQILLKSILDGSYLDTPAGATAKRQVVAPSPKAPKPPKLPKAPKTKKTPATTKAPEATEETVLLSEPEQILLKSILDGSYPDTPAGATAKRQVVAPSFLDKLLHRVTEPPPTAAADTVQTRSLVMPPDYWIPPYIYAAKMGIYLDKMFDTIDKAAAAETADVAGKRSAEPSSIILAELTTLKNDMLTAYLEGMKAAKVSPPTPKPKPKSFKKPIWGAKTTPTPTPDPNQQKLEMLSDVFDKLAAVQQSLLADPSAKVNVTSAVTATTTTPSAPDFWAPDPTAADIGEYYKTKTQEFLSNIFTSADDTDDDDDSA